MTIDETIKTLKKEARCNRKSGVGYKIEKAGEQEQIVEWLEELKAYKQHEVICHAGYNKGKEAGRKDAIDGLTEKYFDAIENILHDKNLGLSLSQALSIYARIMNVCNEVAEQMKEGAEC